MLKTCKKKAFEVNLKPELSTCETGKLAGTFFLLFFFYIINKNWTVDQDLNCHIIVAAMMNEFPKPSRASTSKQTKQYILNAFNKIK
jgi:hypothetical protein